jgi:rhodanese-related sulfurtransferase
MKKIIGLLLLTLLLAGCSAGNNFNESTEKGTVADTTSNVKTYRQITMNEALDIMESESDYIILDVRRPDEFADGHIPGAINLPNENIGKDEISKLPDKNQLILVYCRSGRRSKEASSKLVELGYSNIVEFGGILDWNGEIVSE